MHRQHERELATVQLVSGRGDVGLDLTDRQDTQLCRVGEGADFGTNRLGFATDARTNTRNFTANLSGTASWNPRVWVGFKTTGGAQYANYGLDRLASTGSILPPGAQTPQQGTTPAITNNVLLSKTLGVYVEEQAAIRDRLFLTGAVRSDQNSAFGTNFQRVYYPKASPLVDHVRRELLPELRMLNSLRLRSSWGSSGVQPGADRRASHVHDGRSRASMAPTSAASARTCSATRTSIPRSRPNGRAASRRGCSTA